MIKKLIGLASVLEIVTGIALIITPSVVSWLLFGSQISGTTIIIARIAGFALLGLGLACYPISDNLSSSSQVILGLLTYNLLIPIYFIYLVIKGESVGVLFLPVAILHAVLTFLLSYGWFKEKSLNDL